MGIDDPKKRYQEEKRKGREKGQKSKVAEEQGRKGKKMRFGGGHQGAALGGKQKIVALAKELSCSSLVPKSWKLSLPTVA